MISIIRILTLAVQFYGDVLVRVIVARHHTLFFSGYRRGGGLTPAARSRLQVPRVFSIDFLNFLALKNLFDRSQKVAFALSGQFLAVWRMPIYMSELLLGEVVAVLFYLEVIGELDLVG